MSIDFSDYSDLIPPKTIAVTQLRVRYGDAADGILRRSKDGASEGLDAEFVLLEGPHAKRKFFGFLLVSGTTDGQRQMADRNKAMIKLIIDSAKFLDTDDKSPAARAARTLNYRDLDGIRFLAEIGIEPGRNGFPDKNVIARVITKDRPEWGGRPPIDQISPDPGTGGAPAAAPSPAPAPAAPAPMTKPAWAQ